MGAFSLVSGSGQLPIIVDLHPREALEQCVYELERSRAGIPLSSSKGQVRGATAAAVPGYQQRHRIAPWDGVHSVPMAALVALVADPKITWL